MDKIQIFENNNFGKVRVQVIKEEPWFAAKDVCEALALTNTTMAINRLDEDEVTKLNLGSLSGETNFINEYGLYNLVLASRKKEAKLFKRWITHDVIPTIRKHGVYATEELLDNPDILITALQELKKERDAKRQLELENTQKEQLIGELMPRADYTDKILQNKGIVTTTAIAKDYGMSAEKFNDKLHELNIQYKQSGQWFLYSRYHGNGYTHSETVRIIRADGRNDIKMNTKWTQKGRLFLYNILKNNNIVPKIEEV